jgi:hypothetical protein
MVRKALSSDNEPPFHTLQETAHTNGPRRILFLDVLKQLAREQGLRLALELHLRYCQ